MVRRRDAPSPAADPDAPGGEESGSEETWSQVSKPDWGEEEEAMDLDQQGSSRPSQAPSPRPARPSSQPDLRPTRPPRQAAPAEGPPAGLPRGRRASGRGTTPTGPQASTAAPTPGQETGDKKGRPPQRPSGLINHFPTLELEHSLDVPFNVGRTLMSRMVTFKWKQLVWLLRARAAVQRPGGPPGAGGWRRPHRWLATLLARELASIWGPLARELASLAARC